MCSGTASVCAVVNRGSTYGIGDFGNLHLELRQTGSPYRDVLPFTRFDDPTATVRVVKDFTASELFPGTAPIVAGTEIGKFRFRGEARANPWSWTRLDFDYAVTVRNPLITTVIPWSQLGRSTRTGWGTPPADDGWGSELYAPKAFEHYILNVVAPNDLPKARDITTWARDNFMVANKGCTLTSWTMAIDALKLDTVNPGQLMTKIDSATDSGGNWRNLMKIKSITPRAGVPGQWDVKGAMVSPYTLQQVYPSLGIRSLGGLALADAEKEIAAALAQGNPVILRLGYSPSIPSRHSVLVYGASARDDGSIGLDLVDSYPRNGTARAGGGLPGDRSRDPSRSPGGSLLSLSELDNTFGVSLNASYIASRSPPSWLRRTYDGFFSANCALSVTITDPAGARVTFDTRNGLLFSDLVGVSLNRLVPEYGIDEALSEAAWQQILDGDLPTLLSIPGSRMTSVGTYKIDLTGLQDGEYDVDFSWLGWSEGIQPFHAAGYLNAGQSASFTFAVPEPSSIVGLSGITLVGIVFLLRRRRK